MKDYYKCEYYGQWLFIYCMFKDKCKSANSIKCHSCKHNNEKRDYYEPAINPFGIGGPYFSPYQTRPIKRGIRYTY